MSTNIRPEISVDNKYWISKERYYELKHFCRQYAEFQAAVKRFSEYASVAMENSKVDASAENRRIEVLVEHKDFYQSKVDLIDQTLALNDKHLGYDISKWIGMAVKEGCSFNFMQTKLNMPFSKDIFYAAYRRFFWLLSKKR